jgi:hypothetical protein
MENFIGKSRLIGFPEKKEYFILGLLLQQGFNFTFPYAKTVFLRSSVS